jgi:hypothetical protein
MSHYRIAPSELKEYSVSDLAELVDALPNGCAYRREVGGHWAWTNDQALAIAQEYQLRIANWMESKDGQKNRNRPKPIDPPMGRYQEEQEAQQKVDKYADRIARFDALEMERRARLEAEVNNDDASKESQEK